MTQSPFDPSVPIALQGSVSTPIPFGVCEEMRLDVLQRILAARVIAPQSRAFFLETVVVVILVIELIFLKR